MSQEGGAIALLRDGDLVTIDASSCSIDVALSGNELLTRREQWRAPPLKATKGTLYKYIRTVSSAAKGCVTDEE